MPETYVTVIGAGLAGSEAAFQIARRNIPVRLYEMRPGNMTPAHTTGGFAELVCSNSLGSSLVDRAGGLLQQELRELGSLVMECADASKVPAGSALAVDRDLFSAMVTERIEGESNIEVIREQVSDIPQPPAVIATGPLTSQALSETLARAAGEEHLYFYDAMAPIVEFSSIDMDICYRASRRGTGETEKGDYINCPMNREEYETFVRELTEAETAPLHGFERENKKFFEGCVPVEELASRGSDTLAFGPLRPVGLEHPKTGERPRAVVQLRQDNTAATLYNMVGFQTNLRYGEQERVFRLIPGLEHAEFVRLGQMHRNTFLNGPTVLDRTLMLKSRKNVFCAGQISGVEGYMASTGTGLIAGINTARAASGKEAGFPPEDTMLGALMRYVSSADPDRFQPMKANFGILPKLEDPIRDKRERYRAYSKRALASIASFREKV